MTTKEQVNVRLRTGLRDRIWALVQMTGTSQNAVINELIEAGLNAEKPMQLAFGSQAAFKVMQACATAAEAVAARHGTDQGRWLWDPESFDAAAEAIKRTLETIKPVPEVREALVEIEEARRRHVKEAANG